MQKYIRLLSYQNACKVVDFVNKNKADYANVTTEGVSMQVSEESLKKVTKFLKDMNVRFEINDEAPHVTTANIVSTLKSKGVI